MSLKNWACGFITGLFFTVSAQSPWYEPNSWGDMVLQMKEREIAFAHDSGRYSALNFTNHFFKRNSVGDALNNPARRDTQIRIDVLIRNPSEFNGRWLVADNPEFIRGMEYYQVSRRRFLKYFYRDKALLYSYQEGKSWLSINPILNVQTGPKSQWGNSYNQNTRGIEFRGTLEGRLGFYTRVTENQWYPQQYIQQSGDSMGIVPGVGWWRPANKTGFDFFSVRGYVNASFIKNHITASFGHDKFFIGNGYRSLILSDFAKEYLFVKLNTQLGPFHYQNLYAQLNNRAPSPGMLPGNTLLPKKYMALHRFSALIKKRVEIGLSEMIIFDRDSTNTRGFEAEYFNPIIFYRAIESNLGSRDNALIALDAKAYVFKRGILYGQLVIDEFSINKYKENKGWWANKFGWQLGGKTTLPIKNSQLFLQGEINTVKPYTYSHYRSSQSYTQYGQSLAHPLGANFREFVFRTIFQPSRPERLRLMIIVIYARQGKDSSFYTGGNYGSELYKSNNTRVQDYQVKLLQGAETKLLNGQVLISYMLKHNLYLDLGYQRRMLKGWQANSGNWVQFGIRMNIEPMSTLY